MNHIINNNYLELPELNVFDHLVQPYWMNIGFVMDNVMISMQNSLNANILLNLNNTIDTARNCANLYGQLRRAEIEAAIYVNTVHLFYNQLSELINSDIQLYHHLQNEVRTEIHLGTQYFIEFLEMIHININ